jgi:gliding motility-associated-like protein
VGGDGISLLIGNLVREAGESVGQYAINIGNLGAGANYNVNFVPGSLQIIPAELSAVLYPATVSTAWNTVPELPQTIQAMTIDGRFIDLAVVWSSEGLDLLSNGEYLLSGAITFPDGILNPLNLGVDIQVKVFAKPSPENLILSNNSFTGSGTEFFIHIGGFSVIDPFDNIHSIALDDSQADNAFFEILDGMLFWSSAEQAAGKESFQIGVTVTDRDGNVLQRSFEISRLRMDVEEVIVYNSFTPDGDGINDSWRVPELRFYGGVTIQVFERSGLRLFYTQNPDEGWDGTYQGREMPVGTYFWVIEVVETGQKRSGMLNLMKY